MRKMAPALSGCSLKNRHTALCSPRLLQQASSRTPCLAIFEGAAQGRKDHEQALCSGLLEPRFDAMAAFALGLVEGGVGVAQKFREVFGRRS